MIGKIYSSVTPFYDVQTGQNSYKRRPVLIISGPRNNDYTVLPVSTVTNKQTIVHKASLVREIADMKADYEELYLSVLEKLEEYNQEVTDNALS